MTKIVSLDPSPGVVISSTTIDSDEGSKTINSVKNFSNNFMSMSTLFGNNDNQGQNLQKNH